MYRINERPGKLRGKEKLSRIPIKIEKTTNPLRKPDWIRVKLPTGSQIDTVKSMLRDKKLVTVCEEASCPNLPECFSHGTATFMIMGDQCTRRCSFCDVAHGKPAPLDPDEPEHIAQTIDEMGLSFVVITSVNRDDLRDGGAGHFAACIHKIRERTPDVGIEVLVPDFRGREEKALAIFANAVPDVFNHNIENVPRLYKQVRPGSSYEGSLHLLKQFKHRYPQTISKSGIMLGLGESKDEVIAVMEDLRKHDVQSITLGQYLQPTPYHMPVDRYVHPDEFRELGKLAKEMGFEHVASGPLVRSSYHADQQVKKDMIV